MKLSPFFSLSAASAAAGISASLYFFSGPVSTSFAPPPEPIQPEREVAAAAPVISSPELARETHAFREQPLSGEVETRKGQTYSAERRPLSSLSIETRKLSAAETTPRHQAPTRQAGLASSDDDKHQNHAVAQQIPTARSENIVVQQQPPSQVSMKASRQRAVGAAKVEQQGVDNAGAQNELKPSRLPAVLVPPSPEGEMTDLQAAEWNNLEEKFVADIGGPNQSPSDPEYRARWQTAQDISDAMFRLKFGTEAFLRYNAEAGRRSE